MSKTYKAPPLIEAVCELRFDLETTLTEEQVSAFFEEIKKDFPVKKKSKVHTVEIKIEADKTQEENQQNFNQGFSEFEEFFSEDEKYFIQLDNGRVSIHRVRPYTAWADFFPLIEKVKISYIKTFLPKQLMRIGIRYVNDIILPAKNFSFPDYFTIRASLPSLENNIQKSIFLGSIFEQENGQDAIKVQFTERPVTEVGEMRSFILDFDYFLVNPTLSFDMIDKWLEKAHTNLENVFEGMLTEKTRQLFEK